MARKKEELSFGQLPIPQALKTYSLSKLNWSGLNLRQVIDTGELSMERNISTEEAPYLTPSEKPFDICGEYISDFKYTRPIAMFGYENTLIVIYLVPKNGKFDLRLDCLSLGTGRNNRGYITERHTGVIKSDLTSSQAAKEESIQRSIICFNTFENSTDVLNGEFVKKLLIFPDKVSMYAKIVTVQKSPNTIQDEGTTLDKDCMYYNSSAKEYLIWNGTSFVGTHSSINEYFALSDLEVPLNEYYNDGYAVSSDKGYVKTDNNVYNDGYKKTSYSVFFDGYTKMTSGSYREDCGITFYERIGSASPYTYNLVSDLDDGDSVKGYYIRCYGGTYTNTEFYECTGTFNGKNKYSRVTGLSKGDDVSEYYEKVTDESITADTYYKLTASGEYKVVTGLEYGDSLSGYYVKNTDKTYYTRTGEEGSYKYTEVTQYDGNDDIYEKTDDFAPPKGSDKYKYYYNRYDGKTYCYSLDTGDGTSGFAVCVPPSYPNIDYATVHLSRVFGVKDGKVYSSGYNDYSNWALDTVSESNESNAWCSQTQASTRADGDFTGIALYDNHVICFKKNYIHEIYNNKNPFRVVDVCECGSIDNRSIQEVNGMLFFVSESDVMVYTGASPKKIGQALNIDKFTKSISGGDDRNYYLYCEDKNQNGYLFVYDTLVGEWSQRELKEDCSVIGIEHCDCGMFMLLSDKDGKGTVYKIDTNNYKHNWSFETDLSTVLTASSSSTYKTVNIKHIAKLQLLAYIEKNSYFKVYALYDDEEFDEEKSHLLFDSDGRSGLTAVRLKPRMTANYGYKLHFEGYGYVRIHEMEMSINAGGELYVSSS